MSFIAERSSAADDPLEKAEATKEKKSQSATSGFVGEEELDAAIGDEGKDIDPEETSAQDDPLEKAAATKERKAGN